MTLLCLYIRFQIAKRHSILRIHISRDQNAGSAEFFEQSVDFLAVYLDVLDTVSFNLSISISNKSLENLETVRKIIIADLT
jgi:hypothetical protein